MKPFTRSVLVTLLLFAPFQATVPQESEPIAEVWPGYVKTESYLHFSPNEQTIYAVGLVDGMFLAPVFDAPNKDKYLTAMRSCTKPMTGTQIAAIITKFAKEHPENWDNGANLVAWKALRIACDAR